MSTFSYSVVPNNVKKFIQQIPTTGVPTKVSITELSSRGFKSSNDRTIIPVLKSLQLVDTSGVPTEVWQQMRDKSVFASILGKQIVTAYSDLFSTFPDAHKRTDEELQNFFGTKTKAGARVIQLTVATFKVLVSMADMSQDQSEYPAPLVAGYPNLMTSKGGTPDDENRRPMPSITVNVTIQIPETANAEMIDQIFKSMGEHLYK
jgi:hypothetical protein